MHRVINVGDGQGGDRAAVLYQVGAVATLNDGFLRVKVENPCLPGGQGGKKQAIDGMSDKSRKGLFDWLNSIAWHQMELPSFFTATYGQAFPTSKNELQGHLDAFHRRLRRQVNPKAGMLWKIELQKRGAPHVHALLFNVGRVPKETLQRWWGESIGVRYWDLSGRSPRLPFTRIEAIRSVRGVKWYVGKYIAKREDGVRTGESDAGLVAPAARADPADGVGPGFNSTTYSGMEDHGTSWKGRHWGVKGRKFVRRHADETCTYCSHGAWVGALRVFASMEWPALQGGEPSLMDRGFTLYLKEPSERGKWEDRISRCLKAEGELSQERGFYEQDKRRQAFQIVEIVVEWENQDREKEREENQVGEGGPVALLRGNSGGRGSSRAA